MEEKNTTKKEKMLLWLKRLGFWGFLFFLIKGLIWLAIFFGAFKACNVND